MLLTSYLWPGDQVRFERLRVALDVAARVPVELRRCSAAELVRDISLVAGTVTVVWHSVMWQYVGADERAEVLAGMASLGSAAFAEAPFAHLRFEPGASLGALEVRLTLWPGGEDRLLGTAPPHGIPTRWL